ncbi:hypothetical protein N9878_01235 [bacterium]|nr:hypothetical protein [bacterium]
MATTVQQARAKVIDSILHTGTATFSETKIDRAIIASCNRFLRETRLVRKKHTVSIIAGTITYDLDTLVAAGLEFQQVMSVANLASTDWGKVDIVDFDSVRFEHEDNTRTDKPEMIGFDGDNMVVWPTPDANYTLDVQTYQLTDETGWTIGGTDATTLAVVLNVPARWVDDVLWFGARAYLLFGAPGHRDAAPAMSEFIRNIIPKAKGENLKSIDPEPRPDRTSSLYAQGYNP